MLVRPRGMWLLGLSLALAGCPLNWDLPVIDDTDDDAPELRQLELSTRYVHADDTVTLTFLSDEVIPDGTASAPNPAVTLGELPADCASDDGLAWSCAVTIPQTTAEGDYVFQVIAADALGNRSLPFLAPSAVTVDNTRPRLSQVFNNPTTRGAEFTVQVLALEEDLGALPTMTSSLFEADGVCVGRVPGTSFACTATIAASAPSTGGSFRLEASDLAGNGVIIDIFVVVFDPPPDPSITAITPAITRPDSRVTIDVESVGLMLRCDATIAGQVADCTVDPSDATLASCVWDVPTSFPEGNYRVTVTCRNGGGSADALGALRIDGTAPTINPDLVTIFHEPDGIGSRIVGANGSLADPGLTYPEQRLDVRLGGGTSTSSVQVQADGSFVLPLDPAEIDPSVQLSVEVTDLVGNTTANELLRTESRLTPGRDTLLSLDAAESYAVPARLYGGGGGKDPSVVDLAYAMNVARVATTDPTLTDDGDGVGFVTTAARHGTPPTTPTWQNLSPATPAPARTHAAMAYHPFRDEVLLFGGTGTGGDTWVFDGSSWRAFTDPNGVSPSPRAWPAMAWDANRGAILLFGGEDPNDGQVVFGDLWAWDGQWTELLSGGFGQGTGASIVPFPNGKVVLATKTGSQLVVPETGASTIYANFSLYDSGAAMMAHTGVATLAGGREGSGALSNSLFSLYDNASYTWAAAIWGTWLADARAAYDPGHLQVMVYGGTGGAGGEVQTIWLVPDGAMQNADLTVLSASNPPTFQAATQYLVYDLNRERYVLQAANQTWALDRGSPTSAPAWQLFFVPLTAFVNVAGSLPDVAVTWVGHGKGDDGGGAMVPGARLYAWEAQSSSWQELARHDVDGGAPIADRTLTALLNPDLETDVGLFFLITAPGPGVTSEVASLTTDALEVTIRTGF